MWGRAHVGGVGHRYVGGVGHRYVGGWGTGMWAGWGHTLMSEQGAQRSRILWGRQYGAGRQAGERVTPHDLQLGRWCLVV